MSDTADTTTDTATETSEQTAQPVEMPPAEVLPTEVPPAASTQRTSGWFRRGWRCGAAAAVIVIVAGAFFTIGWFTSTRGDHDHASHMREISRQMNLCDRYPPGRSQSNDQPGQQTPSSRQAYLGVGLASVTPQLQKHYGLSSTNGALLASIDRTGPAFQAGIRRGDIITGIDGTSVTKPDDLISLVANKSAGDSVAVVVYRNGQTLTFQVTLTERPGSIS